jgi:hypothetical protein
LCVLPPLVVFAYSVWVWRRGRRREPRHLRAHVHGVPAQPGAPPPPRAPGSPRLFIRISRVHVRRLVRLPHRACPVPVESEWTRVSSPRAALAAAAGPPPEPGLPYHVAPAPCGHVILWVCFACRFCSESAENAHTPGPERSMESDSEGAGMALCCSPAFSFDAAQAAVPNTPSSSPQHGPGPYLDSKEGSRPAWASPSPPVPASPPLQRRPMATAVSSVLADDMGIAGIAPSLAQRPATSSLAITPPVPLARAPGLQHCRGALQLSSAVAAVVAVATPTPLPMSPHLLVSPPMVCATPSPASSRWRWTTDVVDTDPKVGLSDDALLAACFLQPFDESGAGGEGSTSATPLDCHQCHLSSSGVAALAARPTPAGAPSTAIVVGHPCRASAGPGLNAFGNWQPELLHFGGGTDCLVATGAALLPAPSMGKADVQPPSVSVASIPKQGHLQVNADPWLWRGDVAGGLPPLQDCKPQISRTTEPHRFPHWPSRPSTPQLAHQAEHSRVSGAWMRGLNGMARRPVGAAATPARADGGSRILQGALAALARRPSAGCAWGLSGSPEGPQGGVFPALEEAVPLTPKRAKKMSPHAQRRSKFHVLRKVCFFPHLVAQVDPQLIELRLFVCSLDCRMWQRCLTDISKAVRFREPVRALFTCCADGAVSALRHGNLHPHLWSVQGTCCISPPHLQAFTHPTTSSQHGLLRLWPCPWPLSVLFGTCVRVARAYPL